MALRGALIWPDLFDFNIPSVYRSAPLSRHNAGDQPKDMIMALQPNTPIYSWSQLTEFRTHILSLGGSSDVGSGAEVPSDVDISGRYARQYSTALPDVPGRTITFYCSTAKPGKYGAPGYTPIVVLTGCPWGTSEERNETYTQLALSGCRPNDMRVDAALMALVQAALAS